jgi:serine/threonine protein kinase
MRFIYASKNQIKLCDFGCVSDFRNRRTTFCGTVDYIAPEVIIGGQSSNEDHGNYTGYDQRCDVWQIAVLTFELNSGQTPFTDEGPRNENLIISNIMKV